MEVDIVQPINLFAEGKQYIVPTFQRAYAWNRGDQWELLWEDIRAVARDLEGIRTDSAINTDQRDKKEQQLSKHFMGAIVVETKAAGMNAPQTWLVVDGQQRITTLQLLLLGIYRALGSIKDLGNASKVIEKMIFNDEVLHPGDFRFRLIPRRPDLEIWKSLMHGGDPDNEHLYSQAIDFFRDSAIQSLEDEEFTSSSLVDAIKSKLSLVVISLDNHDDSQLIFEVLNGRQTPLTAADLLKNLIFMKIQDNSLSDVQALYKENWSHLDEKWWNKKVGKGHAQQGRRDQMLTAWLSIKKNSEVAFVRLYSEARSYLNDSENVLETLREIKKFSDLYREIFERIETETVWQNLPRDVLVHKRLLGDFQLTTALPVLLYLKSQAHLDQDDYKKSLVILESYIVRRAVLRWQTRGYGALFTKILDKLQTAPINALKSKVIWAAIESQESYTWPSDATVREVFDGTPVYGSNLLGSQRVRLVLSAIDNHITTASKGIHFNTNYENLTIEHLMPQSWESDWPLDGPLEEIELRKQNRNKILQSFGNLTLLTSSLNSSVSNGCWDEKRFGKDGQPGIKDQTKLQITEQVMDTNDWNEEEILLRGKKLGEVFLQIWQTPGD
jgi:uncharacterized protein with ParB-like and HNH nuclease domain